MRLTGSALTVARRLAETPAGVRLLRRKIFADYGIDALLDLPADKRHPLAVHGGPLEQHRRRGWRGADLEVPTPPPQRTTIADLHRAYRSGQTTPVEVVDQLRERIDESAFGASSFSPYSCLDFAKARQDAEASTERFRDGEPLGRLDGVPIPVKDHFLMAGKPTRCGTAYLDDIADVDAHLVATLRDAGALLYAKTHTTEWGMDPCGFSEHVAMPRNPYDRDCGAGGSSTGTAVAVALGDAPVGIGSDGGGSIRIPSAVNGLFGIKPTLVRIGRTGDLFGSSSVSVSGPIGSSTADLVEFMGVAATVDDPNDPTRRWGPNQRDLADRWRRALGRGVDGCRIGIPRAEFDDLDATLRGPTIDALHRLEDDGATLVDVDIDLLAHAPAIGTLTIGLETMANLEDDLRDHPDRFSDSLRMSMAMLRSVDASTFLAAQRTRAALRHALRKVLDDVDLLALPTTRTTAVDYPLCLDGTPIADDAAIRAMTRFTFLANVTGLPAGSVPVARRDGLPFGLQFVAGAWDEASIFAAMAHAERQGWARVTPPADYRSPLSSR